MLLLQLQIFLIIAVLLIAKPLGNAFFISRFGPESLPYAYLLTALVAAIISVLYAAAQRYFSVLRVNLWSLGICLLSLLLFGLLLPFTWAKDTVAIGLYLWVALFGVLAASQFWMMASMVFDIRQAKRLFGPIGAGAIAGGIAGGYLANLIANAFGIRALIFVAIALLLPCILISILVWRYHIKGHASAEEKAEKRELLRVRPHTLILKSTHLSLLCGIIALSVITAKLIDYQFSALASARFADPDRLTAFFGFWFSTFNVIGLLIQLVITQRVVQRIGVSGALLFLPAGLSLGAVLMVLIPGLGVAIFSKLVDGSLKQSLHRAGVEMLFLPLDGEVKGRIKTYIDVLIDSLAGGIGGLLLLLLINGLGVSAVGISPFIFVFALLWLICVLMIREEYLDAFRSKLEHLQPTKKKRSLQSRHKEVLTGFLRVLEEGTIKKEESQLLYVLERAEDLREARFQQPIRKLLRHSSSSVRARALSALSIGNGPDLFLEVIPLLEDEEVKVSNAALEYLITHHLEGSEILIQERLEHPAAEIAGTALIQLLQETRRNLTLRERWGLNAFFAAKVRTLGELPAADAEAWTIKLLAAAGRSGTELGNEFIARHLRSAPNSERSDHAQREKITHAAILAAGESRDERWIFPLIDFLSEHKFRPYAASVLVEYGSRLLRVLPRYLKSDSVSVEDWRRLPKVLERIPSSRSVDFLFTLLKSRFANDLELRLEVLKALNALRRDDPQLPLPKKKVLRQIKAEARAYDVVIRNLSTQIQLVATGNEATENARNGLITLLRKRRDGNLERLFRLLGLRYFSGDIIPIYRGLISTNELEYNSALEFLDNLLEPKLKLLIVPMVDFALRSRKAKPGNVNGEYLQKAQLSGFHRILRGRDVRQKMAVLYLMGTYDDPAFGSLAQRFRGDKDKRLRDLSRKVGLVSS